MRPIRVWFGWLKSQGWDRWAVKTYGATAPKRRPLFDSLLRAATQRFGETEETFLVRAPGRLNLMGRHIDHRGGFVHPIALPREILLIASPRSDDVVAIDHVDPHTFPPRTFRLSEVAPPCPLTPEGWERWTRGQAPKRKAIAGWTIYAEAAAATLVNWQALLGLKGLPLKGLNALVIGDIPQEAGLSSSSALFIAFLLALLHRNLPLDRLSSFVPPVEIFGYGEWYVGTRGGSGDHAAILLSRQGQVTRIGFFPLTVNYLPFPEGAALVVIDSGERAPKAGEARAEFNRRVVAYEVGMLLWRERFPELRDRLKHLRDATPSRLRDERLVYRLLKALPETSSPDELLTTLPPHRDRLRRLFAAVTPSKASFRLPIRGVCWFGVAECERSERFKEALQKSDLPRLGELMVISHDGDRVVRWHEGHQKPFAFATDDEALKRFEGRGVPFWKQAGSYGCSTPAIDFLVDIALREGAVGAQLSGAGLGGCVMVLTYREEAEGIAERVTEKFACAFGHKPEWFLTEPCQGAEVIASV